MITQDNIIEVVTQLSDKDKKRLANTNKEFAVLYLHIFNVGSYTSLRLTNDFLRYQYASKEGNCILETSDPIFKNIN